jgi:penicillin-binding protein 1C
MAASVIYYYSLSFPLFEVPYATVLEDKKGNLLGAAIADDGQWRFPQTDSVSEKFKLAITHFEDQYFDFHPGFNPFSLLRATWQNVKAGKVVSGGSTLTMQVIRLARHKDRTFWEKFKEIALATRLEMACSKEEILKLYAAHAPFGGNVVGIDAAAWRYFGRNSHQLSWAENALLAVLPNSPSLIYPGKNHKLLLKKRDLLLHKLLNNNVIDTLTYQLALTEVIPSHPHALPSFAPHLLTRMRNEGLKGKRKRSSLDIVLQQQVSKILYRHHLPLKANQIFNGAALILDVQSGDVLAYVGNTQAGASHGEAVDIITAPRSTGSILKPFLYAAMLDEGQILPQSILPDIPTFIDGFAPKNFDQSFEGAVPADEVIALTLNVPAVHMLRADGVEKFHNLR